MAPPTTPVASVSAFAVQPAAREGFFYRRFTDKLVRLKYYQVGYTNALTRCIHSTDLDFARIVGVDCGDSQLVQVATCTIMVLGDG